MTIKELSKLLEELPQDNEILISSDEEGNEIKTIDGIYTVRKRLVIYPFG